MALRQSRVSDAADDLSVISMSDPVNHPPHYKQHASGVECIAITEQFNFCLGNAIKYIWRADSKGNAIEDLEKAEWYIRREIDRRKSLKQELR